MNVTLRKWSFNPEQISAVLEIAHIWTWAEPLAGSPRGGFLSWWTLLPILYLHSSAIEAFISSLGKEFRTFLWSFLYFLFVDLTNSKHPSCLKLCVATDRWTVRTAAGTGVNPGGGGVNPPHQLPESITLRGTSVHFKRTPGAVNWLWPAPRLS